MSELSITTLESKSNDYIPTIEAFKSRLNYILLNNRYTAEFGGNNFWNEHGKYVRFMVSAVTLPSWMIDSEPTYIGGSKLFVPNGFTQGNLDLTLFNTGPELQVFQNWLKQTYNQETRSYGYFDDLKCDLKILQYTTNGELAQEFYFTECTIYQMNGISFSYDPANSPQTFNISLNYFGYSLITPQKFMKAVPNVDIKTPEQLLKQTTEQNPGTETKQDNTKKKADESTTKKDPNQNPPK